MKTIKKQKPIQRRKVINLCTIFRLAKPEEGWFGQPKYSTQIYNLSTLYRFLLFYSLHFIIAPFFSESVPNLIFEIFKSGKTIPADLVQILMSLYRDLECSQWTKT